MKTKKFPPEKLLSVLAMKFRGATDDSDRISIAQEYSDVVEQLVAAKKWRLIPPLEDQLPDEWMPEQFFKHWSLRIPARRTRRSG